MMRSKLDDTCETNRSLAVTIKDFGTKLAAMKEQVRQSSADCDQLQMNKLDLLKS
jgi:hypothetical protein